MKFPTGIEFLDNQIGGVYPGVVVLYEMVGAGGREFAVTSFLNNCNRDLSKELNYIAVTKTEEEVIREIKLMLPDADTDRLIEKMNIHSLASVYFKDTIVPMRWISSQKLGIEILREEKNVLSEIVDMLEGFRDNSMVLLDSLTDLSRLLRFNVRWEDIIDLINGFKKVCVKKNILLMALLTANVLNKGKEEEIFDVADAVLVFEWEMEKDSIRRWLYFRKFLGILPLLEKQTILKYNTKIDPFMGFVISKMYKVI